MGMLVDGVWRDVWYDTKKTGGRFERTVTAFRSWIKPEADAQFPAESGRYHLYVSLACPWAHRTLIYRALKGLSEHISVSVVHPLMREHGWTFAPGAGVIADPINQVEYLHQVYTAAKSDFTGRVSVPVLWDKKTNTIVSNESSEIIRMFNSAFDHITGNRRNFLPADQRAAIDEVNALVYDKVNNGVYKAGFATDQQVYAQEVTALFEALDQLEQRLEGQPYLLGEALTEADLRLFPTLVRFDPVYVGHFKCNLQTIADYPNLSGFVQRILEEPGVFDTVNLDHIKRHYYMSHATINPTGIVPLGPR